MFHSHQHDENCGHSEEQHKRMKEKFEGFMMDVADDLFTEKDLANLFTIIKGNLRECGASASLPNLKVFNAGFEFGQYAANNHGPDSIQLIAGMRKIAKLKQDDIKKLAAKAMDIEKEENNEDEA